MDDVHVDSLDSRLRGDDRMGCGDDSRESMFIGSP